MDHFDAKKIQWLEQLETGINRLRSVLSEMRAAVPQMDLSPRGREYSLRLLDAVDGLSNAACCMSQALKIWG